MWGKIFPLILLLFYAASALAQEDCPTDKNVDLRAELGPIRNQSGPSCYAQPAADLLSHWLYINKIGPDPREKESQVSAFDAMIQYNNEFRKKLFINYRENLKLTQKRIEEFENYKKYFNQLVALPNFGLAEAQEIIALQDKEQESQTKLENFQTFKKSFNERAGGSTGQAIEKMIKNGFCREKDSPSNKSDFIDPQTYFRTSGDLILNNIYNYYKDPNPESLCYAAQSAKELFPNLGDIQLITQLLVLSSQSVPAFKYDPINILSRLNCKPEFLPENKKPKIKSLGKKPEQIILNMNLHFNKKPTTPVAVYYYAEILDSDESILPKKMERRHASTIAGRRFNCKTNEYDYILRNSWGKRACEQTRGNFKRYKTDPPSAIKVKEKRSACLQTCGASTSAHFTTAESIDHKRTLYKLGCINECTKNFYNEMASINAPPYTCEDGYYIISESQLRAGLYGGHYLDE